jgi:hypothetical protein
LIDKCMNTLHYNRSVLSTHFLPARYQVQFGHLGKDIGLSFCIQNLLRGISFSTCKRSDRSTPLTLTYLRLDSFRLNLISGGLSRWTEFILGAHLRRFRYSFRTHNPLRIFRRRQYIFKCKDSYRLSSSSERGL